jgi:NDP-mannose synthase
MRAVILAGGRGSRLAPYTTVIPKPLMPVGDRPILEIILRQLRYYRFNQVTLACGYLADLMRAYVHSSPLCAELNMDIFIEQKPLGTAGALRSIAGLDSTFLAMNGDVLTTLDYSDLVAFHHEKKAALTIAVMERQFPVSLGVIRYDHDFAVNGYEEKPVLSFPVSTGIYVYEPEVLEYIEQDQYLDLPTLTLRLIEAGERVVAYPMKDYWLDIGNRDDFEVASQAVEKLALDLHLEGVQPLSKSAAHGPSESTAALADPEEAALVSRKEAPLDLEEIASLEETLSTNSDSSGYVE